MASKEKCDLDAEVATSEPLANDATSSAVVTGSGARLVTGESTAVPMTLSPVTRRRKMINNSKAEMIKAADSGLMSTMTTSVAKDNGCLEAVIAESAGTVGTEASTESQNSVSSPCKRQLRIKNSSDPIPEKRSRSSRSASAVSNPGRFHNTHSVSRTLRRKSKEVSESPTLSSERKLHQETSITDTSSLDMTFAENSTFSESQGSIDAGTLESAEEEEEDDESQEKAKKKVRNPYGRRGKPNKRSTTPVRPTTKPKKLKASEVLSAKTKLDPAEPEAVLSEWLKPFEEGWRREIVFRNAAADTSGSRKCDIYYFTPDNSKLRSTPQIISYLLNHKTDLTSSCFTFVKRLIYREPAEFVRNASRRSDIITPSAKQHLPKPRKEKKDETLNSEDDAQTTKPALKLKLKRQTLDKSLTNVKIAFSSEMVSGGDDVSIVPTTHDVDGSNEEPQFRSIAIASETDPQRDSSTSLLDISGSEWKLMKPKKIAIKKESLAIPKGAESEQVAVAGEVFPALEIREVQTELLVNFENTDSENMEIRDNENMENKDNENMENRDNENIENKDNENMENKYNENMENKDNENMENRDNENIENKDNENMENKDNENMENRDNENIENKDNENMENKDNENMENRDNENIENKDNENMENKDNENMENRDNENMENRDNENMENKDNENMENKDNENMENRDNENMENRDNKNMENKDNENMENRDNKNMENKDNENMENRDNKNMENKDNENMENRDNKNIENKDNENMENKDNENIENTDNENTEKEFDENDLKLSPALPACVAVVKVSQLSSTIATSVASLKAVDAGQPQTANKTKSSVAKKSVAKRMKPGSNVDRITVKMRYTDGLPDRGDHPTITPLGQDLNDGSVARSGDVPVRPAAGCNTSPSAPDKKYLDPSYNPVSSIRRCGLHCAGRYGMAPSIHCDICMCMFHPECVGISHIPHRSSFTCKACYALNADFSESNSFSENTTPNPRPLLPQPQRATGECLNTPDTWTPSTINAFSPYTIPQVATTPASASNGSSGGGGVQKVSVAGIDRVSPTGHVLSLPRSLASLLNLSRPVTLSISGQKYSIPGSNFMVTADGIKVVLPNNIFTSSSSSTPKATAPTNVSPSTNQPDDESSGVATNAFPATRNLDALHAAQSEVSPKTSPSEEGCEIHSSREVVESNDSGEHVHAVDDQKRSNDDVPQLTADTSNGGNVGMDASETDVDRGVVNDVIMKGDSYSRIVSNEELMLHIFKLLNIVDLLSASRVCRTWRRISEDSSLEKHLGKTLSCKLPLTLIHLEKPFCSITLHLSNQKGHWKSVNLSGVKVIDWELAAEQMTKHNTKSLNLSELVHCGSENQTWHQLTAAFSSLVTVRHLVFGPCPPNLIYFAASKMMELESLKAREIVEGGSENPANSQTPRLRCTKLDIGKMGVLRNLVHLELRGSHGLHIPAFSFSGGLSELTQLNQMRHLSITSLREVPGSQFHFISRMEKLEVLEIGDCKLWTKEDYEHLRRLSQLKRLKLERVVDSLETGLGPILTSLSQLEHLELFSFRISKSSADSLSTMRQLKTLRLYSDTCEEAASSNSYMLTAVKSMKFLTEMTWTILTSDPHTGLSSSDDDDASNAGLHRQPEKLLPLLLETGSDADAGKSSTVEWKRIAELESILKEDLPSSTSVHVLVAQETDL